MSSQISLTVSTAKADGAQVVVDAQLEDTIGELVCHWSPCVVIISPPARYNKYHISLYQPTVYGHSTTVWIIQGF